MQKKREKKLYFTVRENGYMGRIKGIRPVLFSMGPKLVNASQSAPKSRPADLEDCQRGGLISIATRYGRGL